MNKIFFKNYARLTNRKIVYTEHYPVFWRSILNQIEKYLVDPYKNINENKKVFGDLTVGCGGHSSLILDKFPSSYVVGLDIDPKMIDISEKKLKKYIEEGRCVLVEDNYVSINSIVIADMFERKFSSKKKFDYVLLDLGYNSVQLEDKERGISYMLPESSLDMRYDMNNDDKSTAADLLNNLSEFELGEIFRKYGDEKSYEQVAKNVMKFRVDKKFQKVGDFLSVINETYSNRSIDKFNTYARLFQALRIVCNYEFLNIERFINSVFLNLSEGGVLTVITFHSLEEKLIRKYFKNVEKLKLGKILTREKPSEEELEENSRSKSAIMHSIQFLPNNF